MMKHVEKLKKFLKNDTIIDIILFGSNAKGRHNAQDIDIAVLLKKEDLEIKKKIKEIIPHADIQLLFFEDIFKTIFFTLIKEGFSLKKNNYIHSLYHTEPVKLYKYTLKELTASKKVMFERGIKHINGLNRLSNSVVLVPIQHTSEFEDFLRIWNLDIDTKNYELFPLQRKEEL